MSKINYTHTEEIHNTSAAKEVLPYIFSLIHPKSVIDVGCGTGSWLKIAKEMGIDKVTGIDGIYVDQDLLSISPQEFTLHDLTLPLDQATKYDLAICLEVAEHLPEESAGNLIKILTSHSDIILFSAAIPGQGGQFHINEQWPDYWQVKFADKGYIAFDLLRDKFWDNEKVEWWYKQNMLVYARPEKAQVLGSKPGDKIKFIVHPELLVNKENQTSYYLNVIKENIWHPKFLPTLKLLAKSVLN